MKSKFFKNALAVIMTLLFVPTAFITEAQELIAPCAEVKVEFQGLKDNLFTDVKASIDVTSEKPVIFGIVTYKNDIIQKINVENYDVTDNKLNKEILLSDVPKTDTVKVMVWDNDLKPLYDGNYESENVLYVSPDGNENGNGTQALPFSSVTKAFDAAKTITDDVTVALTEGTYSVSEPIKLSDYSGEHSIKIKGAENEKTVIDGGKKLGSFSVVDGEKYLVCDVENESEIYELYVNGHRAKLAQSEYVYYASSHSSDGNYGILDFSGQDALPFDLTDSNDMLISTVYEWSYALAPVLSFEYFDSDNQKVKIKAEDYDTYTLFQSKQNSLVFMNSMDLLDSEGEFYYDREAKKLYYYPLSGENSDNITAYIPKSEGLFTIDNVKNVSFENLNFKHGTWNKPYVDGYQNGQAECYLLKSDELAKRRTEFPKTPPTWTNTWLKTNLAQVELTNCENVTFENNSFANMGGGAIKFDDNNKNCSVNANVFYDIGGASVTIGAPWHNDILFGNMNKITRNISVTNNLIRKTAQILQGSCAISAYYTNSCNISHNDIAESSYSGITLGWGWGNDVSECKNNTISYNKIDNILSDLWDGNHIYTLGDMPGTKVEGNYCRRTEESCGGGGFYPDEGSMNIAVNNNVIENGRNWTFNLTDYQIKSLRTLSDGTVIYGHPDKNITYSGNYVNFLKKYRLKFQDGTYADKEIDGKTQNVCVTKPSYSGYEATPQELLDGFIETDDFSQYEQAVEIMNNAGLESEYKHLENKLLDMNLSVDNGIKKQKYFDSDDYFEICAGDCDLSGGNEVSYYATNEYNDRDGCNDYVSLGGRYKAIGLAEFGNFNGSWVTYKVTPEKSGIYNIYINAGSTGNCDFEVSLDDKVINNTACMKATGSFGKLSNSLIASGISLEAGKTYTLKLMESRGAASIHSLIFDRVNDKLSENPNKDLTYETLASEDFTSYSNVTYSYSDLTGHTKLSKSNLNGGTGWATSWYDSMTEPDKKIQSTTGYFANTESLGRGEKAVYTKGQTLYRKLTNPISLKEDKILKIEFTSRFGNSSESYSGLELLRDVGYAENQYTKGNYQQRFFGLGSYSTDDKSTYSLTPWYHNLVETFTGGEHGESRFYTDKTLSKDTFYRYVAEIEVNADNTDTVRIKAYKENGTEPESWDYVFETELGDEDITHIAVNCQNETYIKNLTIKSFSKTLLASEDIDDYFADGTVTAGTAIGTSLNKGTGWDGIWYNNTQTPESGLTGQGNFSFHIKNAVYLYQQRIYNKLKEPISLTKKQTIRFEFVSLFQSWANQFSGAELMTSNYNAVLGLGSYTTDPEDQTDRHWYLNAWTSNSADSRIKSEKELYQQSYYYRYVAEIDVNPNGKEQIRIKAYDVTNSEGTEPEEWDITFEKELGTSPITHIALNCNNLTYFNSLRIYKKFISQ